MVIGTSSFSGNVGIGTTGPSAKLDVEVASGGAATIGSSDNSATGQYAVAMGEGTTASGYGSTAMGGWTTAIGTYSTAIGDSTTASELGSIAMGLNTTASGEYSTAMGRSTTASGAYSTAIGQEIEAGGYYSVAIALNDQNGTVVSQNNTMAIMGGNVGIGTTDPGTAKLKISGGVLDMTSQKITNLATSTVATDAANKGYVDLKRLYCTTSYLNCADASTCDLTCATGYSRTGGGCTFGGTSATPMGCSTHDAPITDGWQCYSRTPPACTATIWTRTYVVCCKIQ